MLKRFALAIFAAVIAVVAVAATKVSAPQPDFAYPATVTKQAESALKQALKGGNGTATIRALADIALAQGAIGNDRLPDVVKRVEEILAAEKDPVTRSLLAMLLADIYNDIYSQDRFTYNSRQFAEDASDSDYRTWSGDMFRKRIEVLCSLALEPAELLNSRPLADYADIIEADRQTLIFYPTLYDFAASFTIDLRKSLSPFIRVFPVIYLSPRKVFENMTFTVPSSQSAAAILDTYAQWLRFNEGKTAPTVNIDILRINLVAANIYAGLDEKAEERMATLLLDIYNQYRDSEYSGMALMSLADLPAYRLNENMAKASSLAAMLRRNLKAFPNFTFNNCLQNCLNNLLRSYCNTTAPSCVAPGHDFEIKLSATNTTETTIDFFQVFPTNRQDNYYRRGSSKEKLVKSVTVATPGTAPYRCDTTVSISLPTEGFYIAVPRMISLEQRSSYEMIRCSRLSLGAMNLGGKGFLYAIDPLSGEPAAGAYVFSRNATVRNSPFAPFGTTDASGLCDFAVDNATVFAIEKGDDKYANTQYVNNSIPSLEADTVLTAYTDLSIYHPGDTVKWVMVAYSARRVTKTPVAGHKITATLRSPNGMTDDETTVITDDYGRATGSFVIPQDGLTGNARIQFSDGRFNGSVRVVVSDYKMPTYSVTVTAVDRNTPAQSDVTIRGKATTYSGVNLSGGAVKLTLSVAQPVWWLRSQSVQFYSAESSLATDGTFHFEIPADVFAASPSPKGIYTALITVTSTAGESRQSSRVFTLGPTYMLRVNAAESYNITKPVRLNLSVVDGEGEPIDRKVIWSLSSLSGSDTFRGSLLSSDPVVDWTSIPGGSYKAVFHLEDADSTLFTVIEPLILYRPTDKRSPVSQLLWSPVSDVTTDKKGSVSLLYAVSEPEQQILYTLVSNLDEKILERRWIKAKRGMQTLDIRLPQNVREATARFVAMKDFRQIMLTFSIKSALYDSSLQIVTESFRDKIIPGSLETWTFRTLGNDSTGIPAALMLNMYNKALEGISDLTIQSWLFRPRNQYYPQFSQTIPTVSSSISAYINGNNPGTLDCATLQAPQWQLYGREFTSGGEIFYARDMLMSSGPAPVKIRGSNMMKVESKMTDLSASMNDSVEESAVDSGPEETEEEAVAPAVESFSFREGEAPSAFFAPMLTTDAAGRLTYTFTAPNFNTSWVFDAIAFTKDMRAASLSRNIVANKPVMVQPNLPRFLRCGDRAQVCATIFNNSDTQQDVVTSVETFNPATGEILTTDRFTTSIAAGTSVTVISAVNAPQAAPCIGYRIKSSTDRYADGEQQIIPLLPFTTPVIETEPFYIPSDTNSIAVTLPEIPSDAVVTLQYCDNPEWYVVTALPGLCNSNPRTSPEAADAIFSAAIADGLLRTYPEIANALREWTASEKTDSTLVSMLQRNSNLKTILLSATPWMMDAASDTERMQRLALLFDSAEIDREYQSATACLEKLRNGDGGFSWGEFYRQSSPWATMHVLNRLGQLNRLGWLPNVAKLKEMVNPALSYLQSETTAQWRKYPKSDYSDFVTTLDHWPSFKPSTTSQRIIATTVQQKVKNWKKYDISGKADAALMLARHGYTSVARSILLSIREYAVTSPTEGMYWPSVGDAAGGSVWQLQVAAKALNAFSLLEPSSRDIEFIRRWLILQKETRNWGSSATISDVICSILATNGASLRKAGKFDIRLGSSDIRVSDAEKYLGYFTANISELNPSGKTLSVSKESVTPAWGAVYCRYTAPITSVKAESCPALSIEKQTLKQVNGSWVVADDVAVGDRVKVILTIRAERDLQYVAVTDNRAACLEPVEQLPAPIYSEGLCFYRENRDASTYMFVTNMPKGVYMLSNELWVNNAGTFASGVATAQSQYAPQIEAHSSGTLLIASPMAR